MYKQFKYLQLSVSAVVVNCGSLTAPNNGAKSGSGVKYLSVVTFSCNTGYNLGGSSSRTCQSNGNWSGGTTSCTSKNASLNL